MLFKDFRYGMSMDEVQKKAKITEEEISGGDGYLGEEDVPFAGHKWGIAYYFEKGKLVKIVLASEDNIAERYAALLNILLKSEYFYALIQTNGEEFDIVHLLKTVKKPEFIKKLTDIERLALQNEQFIFILFPIDLIKAATSFSDLSIKAPVGTRTATLTYDDKEELLALIFEFPILERNTLLDKTKQTPMEKF